MTTDTAIMSSFPIAALTPIATIISPPTYQTLRIAQKELNTCATSVHSDAGGGREGHLCLTIPTATFDALTGVPFVVPVAPPLNPVLPAGATGPQITEANRLHAEEKRLFNLYHATDKALLKMLIAAVPPVYLDALSDPDYGYSHVTTLQMLTHLQTTYGRISIADRDANHKRMIAPWHPPSPIEDLFAQLQAGLRFAVDSGEPIGDLQVARLGYTIFLNTGLFTEACREWRLKADNLQTFDHLQSHFRRMNSDRLEALTSGTAGYHNAHAVTSDPVSNDPELHAANAVSAAPSTELLASLVEEIRLLRQGSTHRNQPSRSASSSSSTPSSQTSYCWTHGTSRNIDHTSATCRAKSEGHIDTATTTNRLGGSDKIWSAANARTRSM